MPATQIAIAPISVLAPCFAVFSVIGRSAHIRGIAEKVMPKIAIHYRFATTVGW